jgi:hypothetical protein
VCDAKSSLGDATSSLGDAKSSLGDAESSLGDATSSLGDAKSSLGDATSSLGDAKSSLGDAESSLGDATSSLGDTLRARWVTRFTRQRRCLRWSQTGRWWKRMRRASWRAGGSSLASTRARSSCGRRATRWAAR